MHMYICIYLICLFILHLSTGLARLAGVCFWWTTQNNMLHRNMYVSIYFASLRGPCSPSWCLRLRPPGGPHRIYIYYVCIYRSRYRYIYIYIYIYI